MQGKPLLSTWYPDGTIRLYELQAGAFVQLANTGVFEHTPGDHPNDLEFLPGLDFIIDSSGLLLRYASATNVSHTRIFDRDLNIVGTLDETFGTVGDANGPVEWSEADTVSLLLPYTGTIRQVFVNTSFTMQANTSTKAADDHNAGLWVSPNGRQILYGSDQATGVKGGYRSSYSAGIVPQYTTAAVAIDIDVLAAEWIDDTFVVAGGAAGVRVLQRTPTDETPFVVFRVPDEDGTVQAIRVSPDRRYVAISYNDGGTITTVIYSRAGPFLKEHQRLASGFGALLGWIADGSVLADAQLKVAYENTAGVFTIASSGMMTNVVSGAVVQAISTHIEFPTGRSQLYDNRLADLQQNLIDYDDLYVTLMTSAAPGFDPTDDTTAEVLGGEELTTGGWPAGGLPMTGVIGEADGVRIWRVAAADVTRILITSGAAFRYALVYEKTTDKPVLHIDFRQVYSVPQNTEITLKFDPAGMIVYTD
jgi:hypothetical protein